MYTYTSKPLIACHNAHYNSSNAGVRITTQHKIRRDANRESYLAIVGEDAATGDTDVVLDWNRLRSYTRICIGTSYNRKKKKKKRDKSMNLPDRIV
jgi:hypothetical protein